MPNNHSCPSGNAKPYGKCRIPNGKRRANSIERAQGLVWVDRKKRSRTMSTTTMEMEAAEIEDELNPSEEEEEEEEEHTPW